MDHRLSIRKASFSQIKKQQVKLNNKDSLQNFLLYCNFKPSHDETLQILSFLHKNYKDILSTLIPDKYFKKIKDLFDKLAKIVSFKYIEKSSIYANSKIKQTEEIILLSGTIQKLELEMSKVNVTRNLFYNYLLNMKGLKEDDIFKKCLRNNNLRNTHPDVVSLVDKYNDIIKKKSETLIVNTNSPTKSYLKDYNFSPLKQNIINKKSLVSEYIDKFKYPLGDELSSINNNYNEKEDFIVYSFEEKTKYDHISLIRVKEEINKNKGILSLLKIPKKNKRMTQVGESNVNTSKIKTYRNSYINKKINFFHKNIDDDSVPSLFSLGSKDLYNYTLISTGPTIILTINCYELQMFLKELDDLIFKKDVYKFLRKCYIFNSIDDIEFKDYISKYFEEIVLNSGDFLFKENDLVEYIYFIRKGDICINIIKSLLLLKQYFNELNGQSNFSEIYDKNSDFFKNINKTLCNKIILYSRNTIIGLKNVTESAYKALFNAEIVSSKAELLRISRDNFNKLSKRSLFINSIHQYEVVNYNVILSRIQILIDRYFDINTNNTIDSKVNTKQSNLISKLFPSDKVLKERNAHITNSIIKHNDMTINKSVKINTFIVI